MFALLRGSAGFRLNVVGQGVDIGAAIGENILHGQNLGAKVAQFFVNLLDARSCVLAGGFVILLQLLVVGAGFDFLL